MTNTGGGEAIGDLVITPRSLIDYQHMFLLDDADLTAGPILDCPGGASPFGAQVRSRGGTVVSVDPAYRDAPDQLAARLRKDLRRVSEWVAANPHMFDWSYLGSPSALSRYFSVTAEFFLSDYAPGTDRYVAAALPELPFPDRRFRLSLCSHLLFCYPEYLSYSDHLAGLLELMRVTSGELRVFPLVDTTGVRYPGLDDLRAELERRGVDTEIRAAACAWMVNGEELLVCRWRDQ